MARLSNATFALILLLLTVNLFVRGDLVRNRRELGGLAEDQMNLTPDDIAVLQKLLSVPSPSKRQLCKPGFAFNPVFGRCRPSSRLLRQGSMRGRGRGRRYTY